MWRLFAKQFILYVDLLKFILSLYGTVSVCSLVAATLFYRFRNCTWNDWGVEYHLKVIQFSILLIRFEHILLPHKVFKFNKKKCIFLCEMFHTHNRNEKFNKMFMHADNNLFCTFAHDDAVFAYTHFYVLLCVSGCNDAALLLEGNSHYKLSYYISLTHSYAYLTHHFKANRRKK